MPKKKRKRPRKPSDIKLSWQSKFQAPKGSKVVDVPDWSRNWPTPEYIKRMQAKKPKTTGRMVKVHRIKKGKLVPVKYRYQKTRK